MSISSVSFEDVRNAFFDVLSEGGNPSFDTIYTRIGRRGGAEVVRKLITQVKIEAATIHEKLTLARVPGVPDRLVDLMNEFVRTAWENALDEASRNLDEARSELAKREAQLAEENNALRATADEFVQRTLVLQAEITGLERTCQERQERIQSLTEEIAHQTSRCEGLHAQVAHFQRRIGELETSLQAERDRSERAMTTASERHEAALAALTERHQALVNELQAEAARQMKVADERADGDRKHLLRQTDDLRQAFYKKEEAIKQALSNSQISEQKAFEEIRAQRKEIAALREQLAEANGRANSLASVEKILQKLQASKAEPEQPDA